MSAIKALSKYGTIILVAVILIIIASITIYGGIWPPASVVESESMQHSSEWQFGVINTGDIVLLKKVNDPVKNIITYVVGREIDYRTYGEYGQVILYNAPDGEVIIHRAMFYLSWNNGTPVISGYHNQSWMKVTDNYVIIYNCSYNGRNLYVNLQNLRGQDGFITVGDHNLATSPFFIAKYDAYVAADQNIFGYPPVKPDKVVAVAYGQIPWLGLIKLNIMRIYGEWPYYNEVPRYAYDYLFATLFVIFVIPYISYYSYKKIKR
ncbi:S26 family signal peptidase [Thermoplasma acidophilum]|uniref:S26 family signal peptidase n=1 Tax=Thermoplasma acidophilum TaxID=2303 RepID=UPI000016605A|nr:S26 family signal peptidase [Thermoplasma acidophilum]MCY0851617.1 S26 family signal peptidase [Thermoplasma acidophilum]